MNNINDLTKKVEDAKIAMQKASDYYDSNRGMFDATNFMAFCYAEDKYKSLLKQLDDLQRETP